MPLKDAEALKAYQAEYHKRPRERAYQAEYRARPEIKARRVEADLSNRDKRRACRKKMWAEDTTFKVANLLRNRLYSAIKRESKRGSAVDLLGCTIAELITKFETLFMPGMTWENHGEWHIDHVRPLSSFDLENPQELAEACHYTNLQPLWAFDNLTKHAKWDGASSRDESKTSGL